MTSRTIWIFRPSGFEWYTWGSNPVAKSRVPSWTCTWQTLGCGDPIACTLDRATCVRTSVIARGVGGRTAAIALATGNCRRSAKPGHAAGARLPPRAQELGIAARVTFTGPVSHDRKLALYAGARMFLFPSIYEGFGLEPLEAMAHAVPVIAADSTCTPEVTGGAALLLPPDRPTQWAEAMAVLDRDDAARKELIGAGRERAAHLTWERTAAATLAVYRSWHEGSYALKSAAGV